MTRPDPNNAARQAAFLARRRAAGLVLVRGLWVPAGTEAQVRDLAERLRAGGSDPPKTTGKRDSA
jgi:hypothetical protein